MRIIANYRKGEELRFISHLHIQRLLQRGLRRANIPLAYSQGFNPHPLLSFASALAVGYTSDAEWLDVRLSTQMDPADFMRKLNGVLPVGFRILEAKEAPEELPTLTSLTHSALHQIELTMEQAYSLPMLQDGLMQLLAGPIVVNKRTKGGMKDVDIRPQVLAATLKGAEEKKDGLSLSILGVSNVNGSLNIELFMQELVRKWGLTGSWRVHRSGLYFENSDLLPHM